MAGILGGCEVIAVNSGTAALYAAVVAANISPGNLVITSPFTFVATANAVLAAGAVPIYVDVDSTGNMDPLMLSQVVADLQSGGRRARTWFPPGLKQRQRVAAIMPVHIFGQPACLSEITEVARSLNAQVIEDGCEAFGANYKGKPVGLFGDFGAFAMSAGKQITAGHGGFVVTENHDAAVKVRAIRNQGREWVDHSLSQTGPGLNLQLSDVGAAIALPQARRLPSLLRHRESLASRYKRQLASTPYLALPEIANTTTRMAWYTFTVRVLPPADRDALYSNLVERGVAAKLYFYPVHLQPFHRKRFGYGPGMFPAAELWGAQALALPLAPAMRLADVDAICDLIKSYVSSC